ncbi:conserved hypothetical protein [Ricinus communis]|uniref:Protein kinase domain-containing protein n=1 Tax=Ricinus communis TaxID=3988 RepID=B9SR53_RICCO|nr:conserved hypothetical protein [Ricinus communis]
MSPALLKPYLLLHHREISLAYMWDDGRKITDQEANFNNLLVTALTDATTEAANAPSGSKKFATVEANFTVFQTLGKQGVRILSASCNLHYALTRKGISTSTIVSVVTPIAASIILFCLVCCFFVRRRDRKKTVPEHHDAGNEITTVESLQIDMGTIEAATNKFSAHNKLGEGGFGEVYKGTLPNGQEIAVKKLSRSSRQGAKEFKNEIVLLAKLQHRNISDVYSFGVVVIEIICGKKNSSFCQTDDDDDLMIYVWRHWRDGTPLEVLDPILKDVYKRDEVLRCIQIGLLCVQKDPKVRPKMAIAVSMLNSPYVPLPLPQQPALFPHSEPSTEVYS